MERTVSFLFFNQGLAEYLAPDKYLTHFLFSVRRKVKSTAQLRKEKQGGKSFEDSW